MRDSARNNSWPFAISQTTSLLNFGQPKSIWSAKFTVHFQSGSGNQ